jgi:hypothetical protein
MQRTPLPSGAVTPTVDTLTLADDPSAWSALGFAVEDGGCRIGSVELRFVSADYGEPQASDAKAAGILGWSLRDIQTTDLDGLPTTRSGRPLQPAAPAHSNGVCAIDHLVAFSPDLDRSVAALRAAGLDLRRVREEPTPAGAPRQAFFRLGEEILEVVQEPEKAIERAGGRERPLHFWGLALVVEDLDRAAEQFAPHVGEVRSAVQPGRRIATVRRSAGLAVPIALMSAAERGGETPGARATERAEIGAGESA